MKTQKWKVADLKENSKQQKIFGDISDDELQALAEDIERHGLRHPVEITERGVIVDGHQRVRAYVLLGRTKIEVKICENISPDELEERFVCANLNRRQLDPIGMARAIKALAEIEHKRQGLCRDTDRNEEFRDRLARRLGGTMSGRSIDRYIRLLKLPRILQDAVSSGRLPMIKALKVLTLSENMQRQITERIADGESPRSVVSELLDVAKTNQNATTEADVVHPEEETPAELYAMLVHFYKGNLGELEAHANCLAGQAGSHVITANALDRAADFCTRMRDIELDAEQRFLDSLPPNVTFRQPS